MDFDVKREVEQRLPKIVEDVSSLLVIVRSAKGPVEHVAARALMVVRHSLQLSLESLGSVRTLVELTPAKRSLLQEARDIRARITAVLDEHGDMSTGVRSELRLALDCLDSALGSDA